MRMKDPAAYAQYRLDILCCALNHGFHAAVVTIAYPAVDIKLPCLVFHVVAETYALHAAGDD